MGKAFGMNELRDPPMANDSNPSSVTNTVSTSGHKSSTMSHKASWPPSASGTKDSRFNHDGSNDSTDVVAKSENELSTPRSEHTA